jgi:hypothetical protein
VVLFMGLLCLARLTAQRGRWISGAAIRSHA